MKEKKRKEKEETLESIARKIEILEEIDTMKPVLIAIPYFLCFWCILLIVQSKLQIILISIILLAIICLALYLFDKLIMGKKLDKLKKEYKKIFLKKVYKDNKKISLKDRSNLKQTVLAKIKTNVELLQIDDEEYKVLVTAKYDEFQFDFKDFDEILRNLEIKQ